MHIFSCHKYVYQHENNMHVPLWAMATWRSSQEGVLSSKARKIIPSRTHAREEHGGWPQWEVRAHDIMTLTWLGFPIHKNIKESRHPNHEGNPYWCWIPHNIYTTGWNYRIMHLEVSIPTSPTRTLTQQTLEWGTRFNLHFTQTHVKRKSIRSPDSLMSSTS